MALEKKWEVVSAQPTTSIGTTDGLITVDNACVLFKVKQKVIFGGGANDPRTFEIKSIEGPDRIFLGEQNKDICNRADLSSYPIGSTISALKQNRPNIPPDDVWRGVFSEEPAVALRNILVDTCGDYLGTEDNPLFTSTSIDNITIENVDVKLKHNGEDPQPNGGDTVAIGNNKTGANSRLLEINKNLDIDVRAQGWTVQEKLKKGVMCAYDVLRDMTHSEIDGVRRVTEIEWSSASMDAEALGIGFLTSGQSLIVRRTFTYQGVDPFDLIEIDDALVVV